MSEIAGTLAGLFEEAPLLGRVFFASLELLLLASVVALVVKLKLVRTHRLQSLLWCIVLLNALCGLAFHAPLELAVWRNAAQTSAPVAPSPKNIHRPSMYDADIPAVVPSPPMVREIARALRVPAGLPPAAAVPSAPAWWRGISVAGWLCAGWALGSGFFLAYLLLERWRLHQLLRRTQEPSRALVDHYEALAGTLPRWWRPALCVTSDLESPAIVGIIRPVILVPQWLERDGTAAQWTWTLRHELTHWRHGDTIGQMLRLLAQAVFFFHPCVWWAGKRWEEAAELACDRSLLETESDAVGYAQELCELLGVIGKRQRPLMSTGLFASRSHIGRRIELLLADPLSRPARLRAWHRVLAVLALVLSLGVGFGSADVPGGGAAAGPSKAAGAASPAPRTEPATGRVLQFPPDYSMGTVSFGGQEVDARGTVSVPDGETVQLTLNDAGAADLSPLDSFDPAAIQSLSLQGTSVQNEQLVHLQELTGLNELSLGNTAITEEGIQYLAGLTDLRRLNLNSTAVGDGAMTYLHDMTNMEELILNRTQVGDAGLSEIQHLTNLTYLDLWLLDVSDEGMQYLRNLTNLTELGMEDTLITDEGLRYLEGMAQLRDLNLENNYITDEGLRSLANLSNLTTLNLMDTYLTEEGMAMLTNLSNLRELLLPAQIGPDGIKPFKGTPAGAKLAAIMAEVRHVTISITGEGRPLAGAHFSLESDLVGDKKKAITFFRTGPSGTAQVYLLPPKGVTRLRAYAQGYVTDEMEWPPPILERMEIDLEAAMVIGGTVVDTASRPVAGVEVSVPVLGAHNWSSKENLPHAMITDEEGRWSCDVVPRNLDDFWISFDHRDYATTTYSTAELPIAALRNGTAVLTIADAIGLPGIVVDVAGKPMPGVRVAEMEKWRRNSMRMTGRAAISDEDGTFEIKPIRPGETTLKVDAVRCVTQSIQANVTEGMAPIRIVMKSFGKLSGRVVNSLDAPLDGIRISADGTAERGVVTTGWSGQTDAEGRFVWPDAPHGELTLTFRDGTTEHTQSGIQPGEKEQMFVVPFREVLQSEGVKAGRALIERYNDAHSPEKIGHVAFSFRVEDKSAPEAPVKITQFAGIRMAGGEYQETLSFGEDGKGQTPWRHSWDGMTYVHHGHPAPGVKGAADDSHYFVSGATPEPDHLAALDDLLIFVQPGSPTRTYEVVQFADGVVRLAGEGKGAMTIRFTDSERLFYDEIQYFSESGAVTAIVLASEWSDYNSISYPGKVETTVFGPELQKTVHTIELILPAIPQRPMVEGITWEIPADGVLTFEDSGELKTVAATQLDAALMAKKAYWAALTAWVGQR